MVLWPFPYLIFISALKYFYLKFYKDCWIENIPIVLSTDMTIRETETSQVFWSMMVFPDQKFPNRITVCIIKVGSKKRMCSTVLFSKLLLQHSRLFINSLLYLILFNNWFDFKLFTKNLLFTHRPDYKMRCCYHILLIQL